MKKIILILLNAIAFTLRAQIVFEHQYDSASTFASGTPASQGQLLIVNFEVSGERYVRINRWGKTIDIYDMNHAFIKTISLAALPLQGGSSGQLGDVLYLSEQLFNTNSNIEFMYCITSPSAYTGIYDENGILIFSDTGFAGVRPNFEQQQLPIYNTSQGTKLILSYQPGSSNQPSPAKVFSLPGTLTTAIQIANQNLMEAQGLISKPAPNPTNSTTKIDYYLPKDSERGEIVFYSQQGVEIKRYKVDRSFDHLLISTSDIPSGTYYYQLQTVGKASEGKKLVVIK